MAWFLMKDGTKKYLTPSAASHERANIRRRLPGGPTHSTPRHETATRKPRETSETTTSQDEEE